MSLRIDDFKAKLVGGGARSNLFDVVLSFPPFAGGDVETANFMCRATTLPASTMETVEVPFRGRIVKVAGDRSFDNWSVTIYNQTDMAIRNAFERWMNAINAHQANNGLTSPADYQTDMTVRQLDKDESVLKTYTFRGAFPVNVSAIDLSFDQTAEIEQFDVEFAYQYWESNSTS